MLKSNVEYKLCLGRGLIENQKKNVGYSKLRSSSNFDSINKKKEEFDELELYILFLNSIIQNDIFSGICLVCNIKRVTLKNFKNVWYNNITKGTKWIRAIIQKAITGSQFSTNCFLFDSVFSYHDPFIFISEIINIFKISNSFSFPNKFLEKPLSIWFFLASFLEKKNYKHYIEILLNINLERNSYSKEYNKILFLKFIPFVTNCPFFSMEFFLLKFSLVHQYLDEHFISKIDRFNKTTYYNVKIVNPKASFKNYSFCSFTLFDFLVILQSFDTMSFHSQFLTKKILIVYQRILTKKIQYHPIIKSIVKKIKSNFFF
jgi:hypothetical protein